MDSNTSIMDYFNSCDNMCILVDNIQYDIVSTNKDFIINSLITTCNNSHEMPAFGVSIHKEAVEAIKTGIWIKLKYNTTQLHNDMPFDELLINVVSEDCGFNIIRGNNGIYEGRCYYVSLEGNMSILYESITNTIKAISN